MTDEHSQKPYFYLKQATMKPLWYLVLASSFIVTACSKKDSSPSPTPTPTPTASKTDLLKDSVYLYSKEVYLWQDMIPAISAFQPRSYTGSTDLQAAQNVMNGIRKYQPLDRFSFVTTHEASDGLQTGADTDFGFFIQAASIDKVDPIDSVYWFVNYVYANSNAGTQGVQRGWYITKINNAPIGYDNTSVNTLNNVFFGNTNGASFEFKKPDCNTDALNLTKTSFVANSVLYKNVITSGAKKVGYFVFNQFFGQPSRAELAQVFNYFQSQGINELVVDLRYNLGGSVETQDTLANLIAPTSANNQTMYSYIFNQTLQNNQHTLIRNKLGYGNWFTAAANTVKYQKAGTLNLSRVFFIVGGNTASASELLINNLKPYMDVKLVGDSTYGKPVGFFPIPIFDYDIYPISFKTVNSAGSADYYNGFAPDKFTSDGVNKNWGDQTEPSLAAALRYINTGSFARYATDNDELKIRAMRQMNPVNQKLSDNKFSGMFIERK
jgi:C-terminal processing protease CtpA/Prc